MPGSTSGYVGVVTNAGTDYAELPVTITQASAGTSYTQEGLKILGSGVSGTQSFFGGTGEISADGSTAAIGGATDNSNEGGVWVYSRSGASWTEQASKLLGSGVSATAGAANQGYSVSLSADGNTLMSGGISDNDSLGAVWFFTRSGTSWTQQGPKIVPSTASGTSVVFGVSGDLSADGNTAVIGGMYDDNNVGAAWIFTRTNGVWTEQAKLVGSNAIGSSTQGYRTAISADGNTVIVSAPTDDSNMGAAWVFKRSGTTWTEEAKLVGTGNVGAAMHGYGVALSADGNTAAVGSPGDDSTAGATWIFTRSGSTWTQQGNKLQGTGAVGIANFGYSVALSADGNTLLSGGPNDNSMKGAIWIHTRSGSTWTEQEAHLLASDSTTNSTLGYFSTMSADAGVMMCGGAYDNSFRGAAWSFGK